MKMERRSSRLFKRRLSAWAASLFSHRGATSKMATMKNGHVVKETILITGLNGYLAGRTAELALREGYRVRGTVRNKLAGENVKTALCDLGYRPDDIEVLELQDICNQNDLEVAAKGCSAIFHLAAPMAEIWTLPPSQVVSVAVDSTAAVLNAAVKAGSAMKAVVFLSSTGAMFDLPMENRHYTEADWSKTAEPIFEEKGDGAGGFYAYMASKTKAEKLFWKFRDEHRPSFAMMALQPAYFIGPPLVPWKSAENIPYSNRNIWTVVAGEDIPGPMEVYGDTVDIRDIARMLMWSVSNPQKADGQRVVCSSAVGGGQAIADILAKRMPALQIKQGKPGEGYAPDYKPAKGVAGFDSSKALEMMGLDWMPYEESIIDMAKFLQRYIVPS